MSATTLFGLDPATWSPHPLHAPDRSYTETGCWTDVVIELVAAAGHEPLAMLGSCVTVDFETDQWTFFKPDSADLRLLYGLDIHETQPYRDLPQMILERLAIGQTLMPELDAYYLPDTAATSYRTAHVKTSVVPVALDPVAEEMTYFHNAGLFTLAGEDYRGVFAQHVLPPYVELVRPGAWPAAADVRATARTLLADHLTRRPEGNPFDRFGARLETDLPGLLAGDLGDYHAYAFATVRQAGAAFELLASHLRWLLGAEGEKAALHLDDIVSGTKSLSFRLARRRPFDVAAAIGPMAEHWQQAIDTLSS